MLKMFFKQADFNIDTGNQTEFHKLVFVACPTSLAKEKVWEISTCTSSRLFSFTFSEYSSTNIVSLELNTDIYV